MRKRKPSWLPAPFVMAGAVSFLWWLITGTLWQIVPVVAVIAVLTMPSKKVETKKA